MHLFNHLYCSGLVFIHRKTSAVDPAWALIPDPTSLKKDIGLHFICPIGSRSSTFIYKKHTAISVVDQKLLLIYFLDQASALISDSDSNPVLALISDPDSDSLC